MKVVEFLGMPRAGKTTAIEVAESYLKKEGARVRTVYEGARVCPLDKSDRFNYHSWSFHNTVNRILEARLDHYDYILVDRGILDHMAFLRAIKENCLTDTLITKKYYESFLDLQDFEILFLVSPEEAIKRESKNKPFVGRVFNQPFLERLKESYEGVVEYFEYYKRNITRINGNDDLSLNLEKVLNFFKDLKGGD